MAVNVSIYSATCQGSHRPPHYSLYSPDTLQLSRPPTKLCRTKAARARTLSPLPSLSSCTLLRAQTTATYTRICMFSCHPLHHLVQVDPSTLFTLQ